jgi:membrane protein
MNLKTIRVGIASIAHWLQRVVTEPRHELDRWQRAVRFAYDLGRTGARQLRRDQAPEMAAALAFRTLFGLFPVLLVGMIVVKAVQGTDVFLEIVGHLLASAGLDQVTVIPPASAAVATQAAPVTLGQWLEGLVGQAADISLAAVGWVGLALIIYAAVGLMVTIENSFNAICRAPEGRSWTRRVPLYWFVLTVSPVAIAMMAFVDDRFGQWIVPLETWQFVAVTLRVAWSFAFVWLFMFAVYTLIPNATVALRPAVVGALVAALLLEIGKRTMGAYLANAFSISQLYGSLGLVPLFMFWVYLMWLVVLFGLEVTMTLQLLNGRELDEIEVRRRATGLVEPTAVVAMMERITRRFAAGHSAPIHLVAEAAALPESVVRPIAERLIEAGILHRVQGSEDAVSLARPPEQISADQLIEIGFQSIDAAGHQPPSALTRQLRDAQTALASQVTLASLVAAPAAAD